MAQLLAQAEAELLQNCDKMAVCIEIDEFGWPN